MNKKSLINSIVSTLFLASTTATPLNPTFIFCHGLGADKKQADHYKKIGACPEKNTDSFNFPDVCARGYNPEEVNLGQEQDVHALQNQYKKHALGSKNIVLFGVSRGAATGLNFLGNQPCPQVIAAVFESPFDHGKALTQAFIPGFVSWLVPSSPDRAHESMLPYLFKKYNPDGLQPIESVHGIPHDLPILLICSELDTIVPVESTKKLYAALRKTGHDNVYILIVENGKHANILWGKDGRMYLATLHAFYKKFGLAYVTNLADEGTSILTKCQPNFMQFEA